MSEKEIFEGMGVYFVTFYKKLGYRYILKGIDIIKSKQQLAKHFRQTMARVGRHFREFILNLDNCHDYFKLTFTRMRAPSFFVDQEHERG